MYKVHATGDMSISTLKDESYPHSEDGISVDNVYYDKYIFAYEGRRMLYNKRHYQKGFGIFPRRYSEPNDSCRYEFLWELIIKATNIRATLRVPESSV